MTKPVLQNMLEKRSLIKKRKNTKLKHNDKLVHNYKHKYKSNETQHKRDMINVFSQKYFISKAQK